MTAPKRDTPWTPGPWEVQPIAEPYDDFRVTAAGRRGREIVRVWQDDAPLPDYNREQRANAHLIAAAPALALDAQANRDLLAKLLSLYAENFPLVVADTIRGRIAYTDAALRQARGEQP